MLDQKTLTETTLEERVHDTLIEIVFKGSKFHAKDDGKLISIY